MNRKTKIILIILGILVVLCALGAIVLLKSSTPNAEPRRINLPEYTSFEALCDSLDASATFRFMANILGLDERVRPGSYIVDPHMNELSLVRKLRNGQQDPIRLTIGKFRTPQQLNEYLNNKLMHKDFNIQLDSFHLILPDTYEVYWTINPTRSTGRSTPSNSCSGWKTSTTGFGPRKSALRANYGATFSNSPTTAMRDWRQ